MKEKKKIAVFASGSGTNFQAIIDTIKVGKIYGEISALIVSNAEAYAIVRAKENNIPHFVFKLADYNKDNFERDRAVLKILQEINIDVIVLAGYLGTVTSVIIENYKNKIINIHPALLPKYGGSGMYGIKPHMEAIKNKDTYAGATVHFVTEEIDGGKIIIQKKLKINQDDTPESLQQRVITQIEHKILPQALAMLCDD